MRAHRVGREKAVRLNFTLSLGLILEKVRCWLKGCELRLKLRESTPGRFVELLVSACLEVHERDVLFYVAVSRYVLDKVDDVDELPKLGIKIGGINCGDVVIFGRFCVPDGS